MAPGVDAFIRAAVKARPDLESCGLLVGCLFRGETRVQRATLGPNVTGKDRSGAFTLDPRHLMVVDDDARRRGEAIVGVWHSHPSGSARPSPRDEVELPRANWIFGIAAPVARSAGGPGASPAPGAVMVTWWRRDEIAGGGFVRV